MSDSKGIDGIFERKSSKFALKPSKLPEAPFGVTEIIELPQELSASDLRKTGLDNHVVDRFQVRCIIEEQR